MALESYFRDIFFNPLKYIDKFIMVSKFALNKHVSTNSKFSEKSTHIYNFVDYEKEVFPYFVKGNYFLYFGRLSYEKGLETLLKAWEKIDGIKLIIVGTGPLRDLVVHETNDNLNMEYVGYKQGNELKELIKKSSFVIVPSEWYENNPMTIIEAFSYGKPVIASKIGGIPELVIEGKTGFLFKTSNATELVEKVKQANNISTIQYQSLAKNTTEFSENNFDKERHYEQLMNVYRSLL